MQSEVNKPRKYEESNSHHAHGARISSVRSELVWHHPVIIFLESQKAFLSLYISGMPLARE